MKRLMKIVVLSLVSVIALTSCSKEEVFETSRLHHKPSYDIETVIDVRVVPVGDVKIKFNDMVDEVNIDYYNRYGIQINFELGDRIDMPQEIIDSGDLWYPENKKEYIVYIIPDEYTRNIPYGNTTRSYFGYAQGASFGNAYWAVIAERAQLNSTVSHELGHVFGLGHHGEWNDNVMGRYSTKEQYDIPSNFVQEQLDSIQLDLHTKELINGKVQSLGMKNSNVVVFD